tara:strand:+ start:404 stop:691 length:288 start_codon:yes stop_codon:yes gene_type:complete
MLNRPATILNENGSQLELVTKKENNMDINMHNVIKIETTSKIIEGVDGKIVTLKISYRDRVTDEKILTSKITLFTDPLEFKDVETNSLKYQFQKD